MSIVHPDQAVELAPGVHWIGALDPHLRRFDIILSTANGTSYNAYLVRGEQGVAVIDTVKEAFADDFFRRLESVARYDEITTIVLNHLEPDHSGALPELLRRAPNPTSTPPCCAISRPECGWSAARWCCLKCCVARATRSSARSPNSIWCRKRAECPSPHAAHKIQRSSPGQACNRRQYGYGKAGQQGQEGLVSGSDCAACSPAAARRLQYGLVSFI